MTGVSRRTVQALASVGVWLALGGFAALQIYLARRGQARHTPVGALLLMELPVWLIWAGFTPAIVALCKRVPLDRSRKALPWMLHLSAAIVAGVLSVAFRTAWYQAFNPYPLTAGTPLSWFWTHFRQVFILGFVLYWAVAGVVHALVNLGRYRVRDVEAREVTARLAISRLHVLTTQLQPHFLFNALNSISALVSAQPSEARRMLARLSELLRATLDPGAMMEVPLRRELALLEAYLDIERVRFGDRLHFEVQAGPDVGHAMVPGLLLQPLVENSVRHGLSRREGSGHVVVSAQRHASLLEIRVEDDGDGVEAHAREGIGLGNARNRLAELYGEDQSLSIAPRQPRGTCVQIRLPYRTSPQTRGAA